MAKVPAPASAKIEVAAPAAGNKKKLLLLIIGGAVGVLVLGVVLGWLLMGGKDKGDEEDAEAAAEVVAPPIYVALGEKFVATLPAADGQGKPHYLQVAISAMTRDKAVVEEIEFNAPLLRDRLNSLLSRQDFDRLRTEDGKLALRAEVLSTVQGILANEIGAEAAKGEDEEADEDEDEDEDEDSKAKKGKESKTDKKSEAADAEQESKPGVEEIFFTEFVLQ